MLSHVLRLHVNASAAYWWLRNPNTGNANNEYNVNTTGAANNNNANNSNGFSPDCSSKDKQKDIRSNLSKGHAVEAYAETQYVMSPDI